MAPWITNRTPSREAISEGVSSRGKFKTAEVGSTSTPERLPRSETSASENPRHKPRSSVAFSSNNSGSTAMEGRSPKSLPFFRKSVRTEFRAGSEGGYLASITRTWPTNRYPFPTTVSRNLGRSALSPSAVRSLRTMLLTFFSVSINRSERRIAAVRSIPSRLRRRLYSVLHAPWRVLAQHDPIKINNLQRYKEDIQRLYRLHCNALHLTRSCPIKNLGGDSHEKKAVHRPGDRWDAVRCRPPGHDCCTPRRP